MSVLKRLLGLGMTVVVASSLAYLSRSTARSDEVSAARDAVPGDAAPVFGIKIPPGYRDWGLVSVAHEAGRLNDIRAILGNDKAIKWFRKGTAPFPDGSIIARLAWSYVPSEENNKVFGQEQSFVAGDSPSWHLQFMVKDSTKYASTGGWGFAQFDKDGNPAPAAPLLACFACHEPMAAREFVFTRYAP